MRSCFYKRERVKGFEPVLNKGVISSEPDSIPTLLQPNSDTVSGSATGATAAASSIPILSVYKPDTSPVDFTALLRHQNGTELPPDLARIVDAWPNLPTHIHAAILALVGTVTQ